MEPFPVLKTRGHPVLWVLALTSLAAIIAMQLWPRPDRYCAPFLSAQEHLPDTRSAFRTLPSGEGMVIIYQSQDGNVFSHRSLTLLRALHEQLETQFLHADDPLVLRIHSLSNAYISIPDRQPQRLERLIPQPVPIGAGVLNALATRATQDDTLIWRLFSPDWAYGTLSLQTDPVAASDDRLKSLGASLYRTLDSEPYASHFSFYLLAPAELVNCSD